LPAFVIVSSMTAILSVIRWNLSVVLICISFMCQNEGCFFMYLSFELLLRTACQFISPFINWIICSLVFNFWSSLCILDN
jgi:hypothetical protein